MGQHDFTERREQFMEPPVAGRGLDDGPERAQLLHVPPDSGYVMAREAVHPPHGAVVVFNSDHEGAFMQVNTDVLHGNLLVRAG